MPGVGDRDPWWIQIGGGRESTALLREATRRGLRTLLIEPDSLAPGVALATRHARLALDDALAIGIEVNRLAEDAGIRGCATRSEHPSPLRIAARIRSDFRLSGLGSPATETLIESSAWKKTLLDAGLATPTWAVVDAYRGLDDFLRNYGKALIAPLGDPFGSAGEARVRVGDPRNRELFDDMRRNGENGLVRVEESVEGDAWSIEGFVAQGRFELIQLARRFSMRHRRGTLPTGHAWGPRPQDGRADEDPLWQRARQVGNEVAAALAIDRCVLGIDVLDEGDRFQVIRLRPAIDQDASTGLTHLGVDVWALELDLATQGEASLDAGGASPGGVARGQACRLFYSGAQGTLLRRASLSDERRLRVEWRIEDGSPVARPRAPTDAIAAIWVEAEDRDRAWLLANQVVREDLFRVDEPEQEPPPNPRVWPSPPPFPG